MPTQADMRWFAAMRQAIRVKLKEMGLCVTSQDTGIGLFQRNPASTQSNYR